MAYTDAEILQIAKAQLSWDSRMVDTNLSITVLNGVVTISGTVPSYFIKESAEADILEIPGVLAVKNLSIIKSKTEKSVTDSELKARIMNRFLWNPSILASTITIEVTNGSVTITGVVDAYWKKIKAEQIVYNTDGVTNVKNELAVVPTHLFSDQQIASEIISALRRSNQIDVATLEIDVENGRVTLSGTVSEIRFVNLVLETAHFTRGVKDVVNLLQVYKKAA